MKYRVAIAKRPDGSADAWVADLPGCRAAAGSVSGAMELLPVVVGEHLAWLAGYGEPVDPAAPFEPEMVEETEARGEFTFAFDREAMSRDEMETAIRHAGYAHADLMNRLAGLPDVVLDWVPPASSVKIDAIFPDVRSIRMMLEHLTTVQANYYIGSLSVPPADPRSPTLAELQETSAARLRALSDEALGRLYKRVNQRSGAEMEWTARKVMRRIIGHTRFHTKEIEQRVSWLALGVPEVLPQNRE
jgi:predicted RNase H-like HicB family nuclease